MAAAYDDIRWRWGIAVGDRFALIQRYRRKTEDAREADSYSRTRAILLLLNDLTLEVAVPGHEPGVANHPKSSALEIAEKIRKRRISPVEVVEETLLRIERLNPRFNAFIAVFGDQARQAAKRAERLVMQRRRKVPPLFGVPVSVKDIVFTTEAPTTAGSKIFGEGLTVTNDAPVVRRLRRAGAIIIGKTNLHEVALGVTSANEHFGPVRNPHDPERVAGGSSGGSAVAVATGMGPLSVGTDTRGSIRIPAACCGVVGLKPTRGLVPSEGVLPLSPSLDHVGPLAMTVADCALMLEVMAGTRYAGRFTAAARRPAKGMKVGVSEFHLRDLDSAVQKPIDAAIRKLGKLGCRLHDVRMPVLEEAHHASIVVSASEAVSYHDQYLKATPDAYGPLVRQRLTDAYKWTAVDLLRAQATMATVTSAFARVFETIDCLIGAVLPCDPPKIGETRVTVNKIEVTVVDAFTRLNAPQNLAGAPALSLPCGMTDKLRVGLQIIGASGNDETVLRLAAAFQRAS
jgi:aspartyl-tRNA(Asn)/glutamyl-tRNA(Gln) amidotransferase subunit A